MAEAISNTSPLVYLHRIRTLNLLQQLFGEVWIPPAVVRELEEGRRRGYEVPNPADYSWLKVTPD